MMKQAEMIDVTMLSIPSVKATYLNEAQSQRLIAPISYAQIYQEDCDNVYDGFLTRNVLVRNCYLTERLTHYAADYTQLLILAVGLDTKPDVLEVLQEVPCFGLDIAQEDIADIYHLANTDTRTIILACDLVKDCDETLLSRLASVGFDCQKPTFLLWEGGTFYLPKEAVQHVLDFFVHEANIVGCCIDYMNSAVFVPPRHDKAQRQLSLVKAYDVPWQAFFSAAELVELYVDLGFQEIEIMAHGVYEQKVFGNIVLDADIMYMTTALKINDNEYHSQITCFT